VLDAHGIRGQELLQVAPGDVWSLLPVVGADEPANTRLQLRDPRPNPLDVGGPAPFGLAQRCADGLQLRDAGMGLYERLGVASLSDVQLRDADPELHRVVNIDVARVDRQRSTCLASVDHFSPPDGATKAALAMPRDQAVTAASFRI
jgi:hypothetical protein